MKKNTKVGNTYYAGTSPEWEDYVNNLIVYYIHKANAEQKKKTVEILTNYYNQLIELNPVLKNININQIEYSAPAGWNEEDRKFLPLKDVVHGVASGIPPNDIKNYVEVAKGSGGKNIPKEYKKETGKQYVQLTPN